jgi:hypothetical protein
MTACLSDLSLDELLTGELGPADAAAATDHLGGCARCRGRERELVSDRARFRAAPPSLRRRWTGAVAIGALASAAGLALALYRPDDGTRTKGGPRLGFVVVRGEAMRLGGPGERVHPGDTLSYVVATDEPVHVAVVGRDPRGQVHLYVPSERVPAGRDIQLSVATVLDDALGAEQLFGVFCTAPVSEAELRAAPVRAPEGCAVDRIAIEKVR